MKNLKVPMIVACICIVFAVGSSPAGLRLPNLNPFAKKKEEEPTNVRFREPKSKSFLPRISLFPKRDPNKPSTLEKINNGTKEFFAKTIDVLTPWNNNKDMPPERPNFTGSRGSYAGGTRFPSQVPEPKKKNFLQRLVSWDSDEDEPIEDVNDFLSQPRMRYR